MSFAFRGYSHFEIFNGQNGHGVELHHCAKFRQNRGRDIEIFRLFKMAAVAMFDFKNFKFLTVERVKKFEMHQYAKFRQNFVICGRGMVIFRFCKSSTLR